MKKLFVFILPLLFFSLKSHNLGNDTNADSFTEITGRVSITPPPPYEPSDSEESTRYDILHIIIQ